MSNIPYHEHTFVIPTATTEEIAAGLISDKAVTPDQLLPVLDAIVLSGDMSSAVYDPNGIAADAFDMDNMIEGATNLILTAAERALIAGAVQSGDALVPGDIGSTVQAWDAQLDSLSSASANGVSLVTAADYAAMRALLDLEAGTDFYSKAGADAAFQPLDSDLTAIAALTTTSFGRSFLSLADAAAARTLAGLGTAATQNTGTSGGNVPLLNGVNTWSGVQSYQSAIWQGSISATAQGTNASGFASSVAGGSIVLENTSTSGSGGGGGFIAYCNDGAAMASGDRLGLNLFGGSSSASAIRNTAGIAAYSSQAWVDGSAYGTRLEFQVTANGGTSRATKLILGNGGLLTFGATEANTVPALKPSSAVLQARLGDDSDYAIVSVKSLTVSDPATTRSNLGLAYGVNVRETLAANRSYYVGASIPTPTITIATPAVISSAGHGLSANDRVVFNVPANTKTATISAANPAVITMANTFAAGQPVKFSSTGALPIPLIPGTTYYVISAGLSSSQFEVSATVGGAAISTAAPTATFTNGSANIGITNANTYLAVGQTVRFATTGSLPTNFATGTDYYVVSASSTLITVSATNGGSAIVAGSAGSGTQTVLQAGTHYVSTTGALPTGITEGTAYYVISTGLTANAFQISASQGGSAINTTGSVTGSPIYNAYTGNDSNDGLTQTRAGAFLTLQKAWDTICDKLDLSGYTVTVQMADGTYTAGLTSSKGVVGGSGANSVVIQGNSSAIDNVLISVTNNSCFQIGGGVGGSFQATLRYLKMQTITSGNCLNIFGGACYVQFNNVVFGPAATMHIFGGHSAFIIATGPYRVDGAAPFHFGVQSSAQIAIHTQTLTMLNTPAFTIFALAQLAGQIYTGSSVFVGNATGTRYSAAINALIDSGGGGANFLPGNSAGSTSSGGQYN